MAPSIDELRDHIHTLSDSEEKVDALIQLGLKFSANGDHGKVLKYNLKAIELAKKLKYSEGAARALSNSAACYKMMGNLESAVSLGIEATEWARISGSTRRKSVTLYNLGHIYAQLQIYDKALESYRQALRPMRELDDKQLIAAALRHIAYVLERLGDLDDAETYCRQSMELSRSVEAWSNYAESCTLQGLILSDKGDNETALKYYHEGLRIKQESDDAFGIWINTFNIATAHANLNQLDKALQYFELTNSINCIQNNESKRGFVYIKIGDVYCRKQEWDKALHYLQTGLEIAKDFELLLWIEEGYKFLCSLYKRQGAYDKALELLEKYHAAREEAFNQNMRTEAKKLSILYKVENLSLEKENLSLKAERLEMELERQNRELTCSAQQIVQKTHALNDAMAKLRIISGATVDEMKEGLHELKQHLTSAVSQENTWELFYEKFTKLSPSFMQDFVKAYPQLGPAELKVCVLMKANLSTKEIATILGISVRTAQLYRYRIRKKLSLHTNENLQAFLVKF